MRENKVQGIYFIIGPNGVYIGQSRDCHERNELATKLGLSWGIARQLDAPSASELIVAEREVADSWASDGWSVVSKNTSGHFELLRREWTKRKLSLEHREKLIAANRGRKCSEETKARMRASHRTVLTAEARKKISDALSGRIQPRELVQKRADSNRGKKHSAEAKARISAALTGRIITPEWRKKISASRTGLRTW